MLSRLKSFFDELTGSAPKSGFDPDDYRVAAAALLVHMANADGHVAPQEQRRLRKIIAERFELEPGEARQLMRRAEESEREAIDLYQFTSVLKRALDEPGRLAVVELLWDVAYADGSAAEIEEHLLAVERHDLDAAGHPLAGLEAGVVVARDLAQDAVKIGVLNSWKP